MMWVTVVVLLGLWLAGLVGHIGGILVHGYLLLALAALAIHLLFGRSVPR